MSINEQDQCVADHRHPAWIGLASLLFVAGTAHFVRPKFFDVIVPKALPGNQRVWTMVSGGAELATGLAVALPHTRRHGSAFALVLFLAVWPANFKMAFDWRDRAVLHRVLAWGRLPLQVPLLYWAWRVRQTARVPPVLVEPSNCRVGPDHGPTR